MSKRKILFKAGYKKESDELKDTENHTESWMRAKTLRESAWAI